MTDKLVRHPQVEITDNATRLLVTMRDESNGTFAEAFRARLEGWDGTQWIKTRVNAKGALTFDRGTAGAELSINQRFVTSASGTILVTPASTETIHVTAMLVILSGTATNTPSVEIKLGSGVVADHPGVPAGGGFSWSDLDVSSVAGDTLSVMCDAPGGTLAVTVHYWIET